MANHRPSSVWAIQKRHGIEPTAAQLTGCMPRVTLHSHALRSVDRAPRKTPGKLAPPTSVRTRNRWSGPAPLHEVRA